MLLRSTDKEQKDMKESNFDLQSGQFQIKCILCRECPYNNYNKIMD